MSAAQPGILTPIPVVGRYLFFSISQPEQVAATLASLAAATDGYQLVVGIGHSLMLSLGKTVEGMKDYPVLAAPGIDLPSTPSALWCWLRGEARPKPDPDGLLRIARRWNVTPAELVMVGDYRFDLDCGRAAGSRTVLVNLPENPWPELADWHAADCHALLEQLQTP